MAALEVGGESGYRNLTVERILERAGLSPEEFYVHFDDATACFASGYVDTVDELVADLLAATGERTGWVACMRAALESLGRFLTAESTLARGIFLEVYTAGGAATAKRDQVFERLSRAVDSARRETESRHSPPPIAALLILSMIEAAAGRWLRSGDPELFSEAIPDLLYVAAVFYFGREEAERKIG